MTTTETGYVSQAMVNVVRDCFGGRGDVRSSDTLATALRQHGHEQWLTNVVTNSSVSLDEAPGVLLARIMGRIAEYFTADPTVPDSWMINCDPTEVRFGQESPEAKPPVWNLQKIDQVFRSYVEKADSAVAAHRRDFVAMFQEKAWLQMGLQTWGQLWAVKCPGHAMHHSVRRPMVRICAFDYKMTGASQIARFLIEGDDPPVSTIEDDLKHDSVRAHFVVRDNAVAAQLPAVREAGGTLRDLIEAHPEWTQGHLAEASGKTVDAVKSMRKKIKSEKGSSPGSGNTTPVDNPEPDRDCLIAEIQAKLLTASIGQLRAALASLA